MNITNLNHILKICQFADSVLPIGSFAFSNGLESALQEKIVFDEKSLKEFILVALKQSAYLDGIFVIHAFNAAKEKDIKKLLDINSLYIVKRVGKEQQLMSNRVGAKLAKLYLEIKPSIFLDKFLAELKKYKISPTHPVVHAIIMNENGLSDAEAFATYQYGIAAMMLNAALRLMRIDHYQTQRVLFEVNKDIDVSYNTVAGYELEETISFAPVYDCLISQHVSAHVRMFMN